jgi:5-formyltetrahydrofolate cyclo-ligase
MIEDAKAAARKAAFAVRKEAFASGQGDAAKHLVAALESHRGKVLAGYMPMRTEINPLPAMAAHQGPVGVPLVVGQGLPLQFRHWTPDTEMVEGAFKALIPASGDWVIPQVLIVPLLAFDGDGYRLGYGGGFYDRTLEGLRAKGPVFTIGFAFSAQEVRKVPIDATDERLDIIVTEKGTWPCP